jgi:hypothetical protein
MIKEQWIKDCEQIQNMNFENPTQVAFVDQWNDNDEPDMENVIGGIAYGTEIICGECGSIVDLEDVCALYIFGDWITISEEILGDDIGLTEGVNE